MTTKLHRIIYCSRNAMDPEGVSMEDELNNILASSRRNNPRAGVTGALLYNSNRFAQILEGPLLEVERVFECIQSDQRHDEIAVIESSTIPSRIFPEWAMAFVAPQSCKTNPRVTEAFEAVFAGAPDASSMVLTIVKELVEVQA